MKSNGTEEIELSVVIPCLNEENTISTCVELTLEVLRNNHIRGEVIVADNNSTDRSAILAQKAGAKVIQVLEQGYGSALRKGIEASNGKYIVFFDADLSYNPEDLIKILDLLRKGHPIVIGSRMKGTIEKGAMPWTHRYVGTPIMTLVANILFRSHISDINSGMRGLSKEAFVALDLHSEGMEFASEMIAKARWANLEIVEVPIQFHRDKRGRRPHLHSVRDGWRHLQLMFHFSSLLWFITPGTILLLTSFLIFIPITNINLLYITFLISLFLNIIGIQILLIGIIAQGRVKGSKFKYNPSKTLLYFSKIIKVEKGIVLGLLLIITSIFFHVFTYTRVNISELNTLKIFWVGNLICLLGTQILFSSILIGLFGIRVSEEEEFFKKNI